MFRNNDKIIIPEPDLLFLCNYKFKETTRACCLPAFFGAYVGKRDEDYRHKFTNLSQLTALYDKYHDKFGYDATQKNIKQYMMTMRIYGTINGCEIQPYEIRDRSDGNKFY